MSVSFSRTTLLPGSACIPVLTSLW